MGGTISISIDTAIKWWHSQEDYTVLLLGTSLQIKCSYYGNVQVASRRSRDCQTSKTDDNLEVTSKTCERVFCQTNVRIYNVWSQQRRQGKKEMLDAIRDFFNK